MNHALRLYASPALRQAEHYAQTLNLPHTLMYLAGQSAAQLAATLKRGDTAPVLVLAGPGNNGGDACYTAGFLARQGIPVELLLCADPARYGEDATQAWAFARSSEVSILPQGYQLPPSGDRSLIIDGLFGIGLSRSFSDNIRHLIREVNQRAAISNTPILALDVPSGLSADTGALTDAEEAVIHASHTLTFLALKPGLFTAYGKECCGQITLETLGAGEGWFPASDMALNYPGIITGALPARRENSHKGSYGHTVIAGGAYGTVGAALLAARAALFAGAGKVSIDFPDQGLALDTLHPEIMCHPNTLPDWHADVYVTGPGLGISDQARQIVMQAIRSDKPQVLDADALNLIAAHPNLLSALSQRTAPTLITPHPLEAARLLKTTAGNIQSDRISAARTLAQQTGTVVILKGAGSIISAPDGRLRINTSGNAGLASGGSGDVLAGLCGALLAQGMNTFDAACLAACVHGQAADDLVAQGHGPAGLTAGELPVAIRRRLNHPSITELPATV